MKPRLYNNGYDEPIGRIRVPPEDCVVERSDTPDSVNDPFAAPRQTSARGERSRRPHSSGKIALVRRLIEETTLTYGQIAARTGVGRASICRWTRDGAWKRPLFAPRATDTIPRARASQKLKLRLLAERLRVLAERYVQDLETELEEARNAGATPDPAKDYPKRLGEALAVLKMARLEAMGRRRRRRLPGEKRERLTRYHVIPAEIERTVLKEYRRGGVNLDAIPQEALDVVMDARMPPDEHPALRPKGRSDG